MILPAYFARQATRGKATVAIVPIQKPRTITRGGQPGYKRPVTGKGTTYTTSPWQPREGSHETLRSNTGRKTLTVADIVIGPNRQIQLDELLHDDPDTLNLIRATGCKTRAEFAREWMRHSDKNWPATEEALCPRCQGHNLLAREWVNPITGTIVHTAVECPDCDEVGTIQVDTFPSDSEILDRFRARHAHRSAWLVHFALDGIEHRRLLSPAGRPRGDDLGYTENPADALSGGTIDAGEAVPANVQTAYVLDAQERRRQAAHIETMNERQVIADAIRSLEGKSSDVRVARELRHMKARLRKLDELLKAA